MESYSTAKYETKLLFKQELQSIQTTLNYSWKFIKNYKDELKIILSYLHYKYMDYVGMDIEHVCNKVGVRDNAISLAQAALSKAVIKPSYNYLISTFKMPVDTTVWNFDILFNKDYCVTTKCACLYIQAILPPYLQHKWIPEPCVPNEYKYVLLEHNIIQKDLSGYLILI